MTHDYSAQMADLPGSELDVAKIPGHWLACTPRQARSAPWRSQTDASPSRWAGYRAGRRGCGVCARPRRDGPYDPAMPSTLLYGCRTGRQGAAMDSPPALAATEWSALLEGVGFRIVTIAYAPMHLLRPVRLIQDEGIVGALRLAKNLILDGAARRRVFAMRQVFERYRQNLCAICIVAQKD